MGRTFLDSSPDPIRLQRRIDRTRRSQIQSFKEFQRLQAERQAQELTEPQPEPAPVGVNAVSSTDSEQIGSVPSPVPKTPNTEPILMPPAATGRPPATARINKAYLL